jgi:uncharacterized protein YpiB (UPF0302 family)
MDKYYSYTDFLRAVGHFPKVNDSEKLLNDIYLDLFLNRLLRLQRISQLEQLIDSSLDARNERDFQAYTTELISLRKEQKD